MTRQVHLQRHAGTVHSQSKTIPSHCHVELSAKQALHFRSPAHARRRGRCTAWQPAVAVSAASDTGGTPKLGVHALVWEGGWSREEATRVIAGSAKAGYDLVEGAWRFCWIFMQPLKNACLEGFRNPDAYASTSTLIGAARPCCRTCRTYR